MGKGRNRVGDQERPALTSARDVSSSLPGKVGKGPFH